MMLEVADTPADEAGPSTAPAPGSRNPEPPEGLAFGPPAGPIAPGPVTFMWKDARPNPNSQAISGRLACGMVNAGQFLPSAPGAGPSPPASH